MTQDPNIPVRFNETVVIMEDQPWIWQLVTGKMTQLGLGHVRLPSTVPLRQSWDRLKHAEFLIILWEGKQRSGGAIIEEILSVQANFDVSGRIIVLTTNPTHEDVVYFSELGVKRIIRLRNRDKDLIHSGEELALHLKTHAARDPAEEAWRRVHLLLDNLGASPAPELLAKLEDTVRRLKTGTEYSARHLDALAKLYMVRGNDEEAMRTWQAALEKNPNYYRTYHNLIDFHRRRQRPQEALALMQKMHELNKQNIARLVGMAEIQMETKDYPRAESYFTSALGRDPYCSGALNGLAEIRFHHGDLEEARQLLARSHQAYKAAVLNRDGIDLVRQQKYQAALDHYTRAQYVLPQQDKGPLLFFNIGLCYMRWGRYQIAREFLRIAIIKEPNFKKAQRLLDQVEDKLSSIKGFAA